MLSESLFLNVLEIDYALTTTFSFLPETKGRSLEEMDIIFGSTSRERREADIAKQAQGEIFSRVLLIITPLTCRSVSQRLIVKLTRAKTSNLVIERFK